jgi:glutamate racemase
VVDVVSPVIDLFRNYGNQHKIGVIGTKGTIQSGIYSKKILNINNTLSVASLATPLLCPMIEEGFINDDISQAVIDNYLSNSELNNIQSIILACTHYPLIKKQISSYYQDKIEVLDSAEITATHIKKLLQKKNLLNDLKTAPHHFYVSDYTKSFEESTRFFFKEEIKLEKGTIWS